MKKNIYIDVKYIDASQWQSQDQLSSGGTRAKRILENRNGKQFFFKESERKKAKGNQPEKYYQYEFFNEIIAYQLGKQLGLDMLRYDIAIFNGTLGCLSPRMHNLDKEEQLVEFGKYMIAINPNFDPNANSARKEYTFQLLEEAFNVFEHKEKYIQFIFKVLLFDAIIGNVDRHQENWAFITLPPKSFIERSASQFSEMIKDKNKPKFINKWIKKIFKVENEDDLEKVATITELFTTKVKSTAPIYDSGSSLAREITEKRVIELLNDEVELKKYILKGQAELHWHNEKKSHFDLIDCLLATDWKLQLLHESKFIDQYEEGIVEKIIDRINKKIPTELENCKIPASRKKLISKIVSLRIQELKLRLSAGV